MKIVLLLTVGLLVLSVTLAGRPFYPLYAIDSLPDPNLSDADLEVIATNFSHIQARLTDQQLGKLQKINPNFAPVNYINTDAAGAREVEPISRFGAAFYLVGELTTEVSETDTTISLNPAESTSPLKASSIEGNFSGHQADQYVTFLRVGDELMRIDRVSFQRSDFTSVGRLAEERRGMYWSRRGVKRRVLGDEYKATVLHVTRGFGGTKAESHKASAQVFAPLYNAEGYPGGTAGIIYTVDPASEFGVQRLVNHTLQVRYEGYAGSWFDCFSASQYNAVDMGGKRFKHGWDFANGSYFTSETFLAAQKKRLSLYWAAVHANLSYYPTTLANNLNAGYWPDQGNDRSMLIPTSDFRPVDGYCMECFIGKEMLSDPYSYGCNISALNFTWLEDHAWRESVRRLMDAAQNSLAAFPMVAQAGCKSVKLEIMKEERDQVESFAYASYLLAVNSSTGPTRLGIPAFYQENGKRFAHVHERYSWPIGEPLKTFGPDDIDKYQPSGHQSYVRSFSNGLIIVNPFTTEDNSLNLDKEYYDPTSSKSVSIVNVSPHTGMILLTKPPTH